jgi:hypothetical protein
LYRNVICRSGGNETAGGLIAWKRSVFSFFPIPPLDATRKSEETGMSCCGIIIFFLSHQQRRKGEAGEKKYIKTVNASPGGS